LDPKVDKRILVASSLSLKEDASRRKKVSVMMKREEDDIQEALSRSVLDAKHSSINTGIRPASRWVDDHRLASTRSISRFESDTTKLKHETAGAAAMSCAEKARKLRVEEKAATEQAEDVKLVEDHLKQVEEAKKKKQEQKQKKPPMAPLRLQSSWLFLKPLPTSSSSPTPSPSAPLKVRTPY
jgi:hypothetical protein